MARVIEFYVPCRYRRQVRWVPPHARGRVIMFRRPPSRPTEQGWRILGISGDPAEYFKVPKQR